MIKTLILFLLSYWLGNGLLNKKSGAAATGTRAWLNRTWLIHAGFFVIAATILSIIFGAGSFLVVLVAAVVSGGVHYIIYITLVPLFKENLTHYFIHQAIQIGIIYTTLWASGLAGNPSWMLDQMYTFLFADKLVIDQGLVVPSLLLMLVFLTSTSSEIISKLLDKYGNPIMPHMQEAAAAIEPVIEGSLLKKRNLKQGILADMTVEEQIEVSNEADANNPVKTKESIKVQYHWYNKAEDSSKGKYIGILERLLICVFVFYQIYQGLVLLGAMKTLARFKLFENKAFAEYYLIGTLLSLLLATVCGFWLQRMLLGATLR